MLGGCIHKRRGKVSQNRYVPGRVFNPDAWLQRDDFRDYYPAAGRYVEADPMGLIRKMVRLRQPVDTSDLHFSDTEFKPRSLGTKPTHADGDVRSRSFGPQRGWVCDSPNQ